jgi:acetyl esterase/lipase
MLCDSADFAPRGVSERLAALLLRSTARLALKPVLSPKVPIPWQRWWLRQLTRWPRSGQRIKIQADTLGGVPGEWMLSGQAAAGSNGSATILYLHGGGYCIGSPATHRAVTSRLARTTGLPVFAADYRLAPEHPFPAALDDAVSAYRSLLESGPVVIAGDSAGGGLALATSLTARNLHIDLPRALILFSPWADLATSVHAGEAAERDAVLSDGWLNACADHYLAGRDPTAPLASPVYGDLRGLSPTLILAASDELLHGDAVRIHDALSKAGVAVRCEILSACWHGFQSHAGSLRAANAVIERVARFIAVETGSAAVGSVNLKAV